jgi:hypothetical protein
MRSALLALVLLALNACVEEPTPQEAGKAVEVIEQDAVRERQLSIEEAAEEATKLIEADAKAEIDVANSANSDK